MGELTELVNIGGFLVDKKRFDAGKAKVDTLHVEGERLKETMGETALRLLRLKWIQGTVDDITDCPLFTDEEKIDLIQRIVESQASLKDVSQTDALQEKQE